MHIGIDATCWQNTHGYGRHARALLVMVGEYAKDVFHSDLGTIKAQVEKLGIADRVIFTGYLPDEDLVVLLSV